MLTSGSLLISLQKHITAASITVRIEIWN